MKVFLILLFQLRLIVVIAVVGFLFYSEVTLLAAIFLAVYCFIFALEFYFWDVIKSVYLDLKEEKNLDFGIEKDDKITVRKMSTLEMTV